MPNCTKLRLAALESQQKAYAPGTLQNAEFTAAMDYVLELLWVLWAESPPSRGRDISIICPIFNKKVKIGRFHNYYVSIVKTLHVLVRAEVGTFKGIALSLTLKRFKEKFNLCVKREGSNYTPNLGGHQETPKFSSFAC